MVLNKRIFNIAMMMAFFILSGCASQETIYKSEIEKEIYILNLAAVSIHVLNTSPEENSILGITYTIRVSEDLNSFFVFEVNTYKGEQICESMEKVTTCRTPLLSNNRIIARIDISTKMEKTLLLHKVKDTLLTLKPSFLAMTNESPELHITIK